MLQNHYSEVLKTISTLERQLDESRQYKSILEHMLEQAYTRRVEEEVPGNHSDESVEHSSFYTRFWTNFQEP